MWHCPGTLCSGDLDSRGKVGGEVKNLPLSVVFKWFLSTSVCLKVEFDPCFEWNFCVSFSIGDFGRTVAGRILLI